MRTDAKTIAQLELPTHLTAAQCKAAIHAWYSNLDAYEWAVFDEFNPYTGGGVNRIDVFAINCYGSESYTTVAYEIKVSRSDFLQELRRPNKRRLALAWSNAFYFLAPVGLIKPEELPVECGLKEVMPDLTIKHTQQAERRDRLPPSWAFLAAVARRAIRVERKDP